MSELCSKSDFVLKTKYEEMVDYRLQILSGNAQHGIKILKLQNNKNAHLINKK